MSDDTKKVQYELSLNDLLTGKLKEAGEAANNLDGGLHNIGGQLDKIGEKSNKVDTLKDKLTLVGETASKIAEAFDIPTDLSKGIEFVKSATEEYQKLNLAQRLLKTGLESTQYAAGMTFEELKDGAEQSAKTTKFSEEQIISMQTALLTFPAITKQIFGSVSSAIEDMSTRSGQDLKTTAKQVGQALQDPAKGITTLGLNFSDAQQQIIKKLTETGHTAEAQGIIIQEMNRVFKGSAAAAANADVLFKYNQLLGDFKDAVGEAATKLLVLFKPALEGVATLLNSGFAALKNFYDWCLKNKVAIEMLAGAIVGGATAYAVYQLWAERAVLWSSIKTAYFIIEAGVLTGLGTAVEFVNAMFIASPVGWIVLGFAAITAGVIYCWTHFTKFRAVLMGLWEFLKTFFEWIYITPIKVLQAFSEMVEGFLHLDTKKMTKGWEDAKSIVFDGAKNLGASFKKGYDEGIADFAKDQEKGNAPKEVKLIGSKGINETNKPTPTSGSETQGVTGNKSTATTINIKIGDLVKELNIHSTTIQSGAKQLQQLITEVLLSAVNDSQRIAHD